MCNQPTKQPANKPTNQKTNQPSNQPTKQPTNQPDMLPGVQSGNEIPHDRCNICGIAHAHTNRKDDIFMERQRGQIITCILERGQGT